MKFFNEFVTVLMCISIQRIEAAASDLKFDFSGYKNVAKLLVANCATDIHNQINKVLGGAVSNDAVEIPTTNTNLPHLTCAQDPVMGSVINVTLYKTDNDPATQEPDRQRLEMKVFEKSPTLLKATNNSNYIYSWWFYLDPTLKAGDGFFHIFQIKAVGKNVDSHPLATFTLTRKNGLHLRLRKDNHLSDTYHDMVPLSTVLGKWTQAFVKVSYRNGNAVGASTSGTIAVILKDQLGKTLFPQNPTVQKVFYNDMYWKEANFYRPKWGLYREKSNLFQSADWELFQNIQIWNK